MGSEKTTKLDRVQSPCETARLVSSEEKAALAPFWEEIRDTWAKLVHAPESIVLFAHKTNAVGPSSSTCMARYCDRTWMIHQNVGEHDPGGILENILEVSRWAAENPQCDYVRFLYRAANQWPSLILGQLTAKLREGSHESHVFLMSVSTISAAS